MLDSNRLTPFFNERLPSNIPEDVEHSNMINTNFTIPNAASTKGDVIASENDYECCPNCERRFFKGRLHLHLKSCKDGKPLKLIKKSLIEKTDSQSEALTVSTKHTELTTNAKISTLTTEEHDPSAVFQDTVSSQEKVINSSPSQPHQQKTTKEPTSSEDSAPKDEDKNKFIQKDKHNQQKLTNRISNDGGDEKLLDVSDNIERLKAEDGRVGCTICNRLFHEDRISKHEKACTKSSKKRPVFNTTKQRAISGQGEELLPKKAQESPRHKKATVLKEKVVVQEEVKDKNQGKKLPKWKAEHQNFLKNLQFNRKVKAMEKRGEDTSNLVAPTIINDSYVDCPYCFRKFAPATAERHIPKCKDIFNRPKPPRSLKLVKIEDVKSNAKLKSQINAEKEPISNRKTSNNVEIKDITVTKKSVNANLSINTNEKLDSVISQRSPQSNFTSRNPDSSNINSAEEIVSPKETVRLPHFISPKTRSKLVLKKIQNETSNKQHFLPDIHKTEADNSLNNGYELQLSEQKDRSVRSQSPTNTNKEGKRIFSERIPKKDNLLQNYQNIIARSSGYSTVTCPHCLRNFAFQASERHIPICKNTQTRIMKKSYEHDNYYEEKIESKMYLTNLVAKYSFRPKIGDNDKIHPSTSHSGIESIDGNLLSLNGKATVRTKPTFASRRLLPELTDMNIPIIEKPSLLQKPKLVPSIPVFCTCCGAKFTKAHKFCGNCGTKKSAL